MNAASLTCRDTCGQRKRSIFYCYWKSLLCCGDSHLNASCPRVINDNFGGAVTLRWAALLEEVQGTVSGELRVDRSPRVPHEPLGTWLK